MKIRELVETEDGWEIPEPRRPEKRRVKIHPTGDEVRELVEESRKEKNRGKERRNHGR